jgi:hypothetical protein
MSGIYNDEQFKDLMNRNYFPLDNMKRSVARLKASDQIDIQTMEYGQYQPILSPTETWPRGVGKAWYRSVGQARIQLSAQPNTTPLSNDERVVVPSTKCALLDASVRKCFNSEPPIPILIDVAEQKQDAPDADLHDIRLVWEYENGEDQVPTLLRLTMVCPFRPTSQATQTSAEAHELSSSKG